MVTTVKQNILYKRNIMQLYNLNSTNLFVSVQRVDNKLHHTTNFSLEGKLFSFFSKFLHLCYIKAIKFNCFFLSLNCFIICLWSISAFKLPKTPALELLFGNSCIYASVLRFRGSWLKLLPHAKMEGLFSLSFHLYYVYLCAIWQSGR